MVEEPWPISTALHRSVAEASSLNFTKAAEEDNAENLLVVRDKKLAELYSNNWNEHFRHSEVYIGKAEASNREPNISKAGPQLPELARYYSSIWQKIKREWTIPDDFKGKMNSLEAILNVTINRDGTVQKISYEKRSGNSQYDQFAWEAINKARPFPPIPKEIKGETLELGIRFHPE